jgi:hypothetical protein
MLSQSGKKSLILQAKYLCHVGSIKHVLRFVYLFSPSTPPRLKAETAETPLEPDLRRTSESNLDFGNFR